MNKISNSRQSNFELLRIICMLLIVAIHYCKFGFIYGDDEPMSTNLILQQIFSFGGRMGVDMFVMISGYFMINQEFRGTKAIRLWFQCFCALILVGILLLAFKVSSVRELRSVLMETLSENYWFINTYFIMYLFSDYINAMIRAVSREKLLWLIGAMMAIVSILPTFFGIRLGGSNLLLFVMLYIIAAYIRLYSPKLLNSKLCLPIGLAFHWICCAIAAVLFSLKAVNPAFGVIADRMSSMPDFTIIICAVLVFSGFKNLDIGSSRIINGIAACCLGVYLLHFNPISNEFIWKTLLHTPEMLYSPFMLLHALFSVAVMFSGCAAIDYAFRRLMLNPFMAWLNPRWDKTILSLKSKITAIQKG